MKNNSVFSTIIKTNISHALLNSHLLFFMEGFEIVDLEDVDLNEELPDDKTENTDLKTVNIQECLSIPSADSKNVICSFLKSVDTN